MFILHFLTFNISLFVLTVSLFITDLE
uniref:Uncharacterized protein n=1 Tax=Lepeophtheirus salmonis TaxID=72036 RepID=A0A0K2VBD3_LEPSM